MNKKTTTLISMIDRAWRSGIDASSVLFDSWFSHDEVISKIYAIGYGVICRLKKSLVKYEYQGQKYTQNNCGRMWQRNRLYCSQVIM